MKKLRIQPACCLAVFAIMAIIALPGRTSKAGTYNWQGNTLTGTWNTVGATGWDGGPPNAPGDVIQRITALTGDVDITQSVNNVTIGGVVIGNGTDLGNHYFQIDFASSRVLNFNNNGSDATVVWDNPSNPGSGEFSQLWFGGAGSVNLQDNLKINILSTTNNLTPGGVVAFDVPISGSKNIAINSAHPIQNFGISTTGQVQTGVAFRKANTYTGTTTVERGSLQILNGTSLGNSANTLNLGVAGSDSAALMTGATMTVVNPIVVASGNAGTLTIDNPSTSGGVVVTFSGNITLGSNVNIYSRATDENLIFTGVISGSGGVVLPTNNLNGRISFRGANTYEGDTNIDGQTLVIRNGSAIPNGTGKGNVVMGGGTLLLRASETINGLSGTGTVSSEDAPTTLTLGDNDETGAFSGAIVNGSGTSLAKMGSETQTLSGANTYAGTTTINDGTLLINGTHTGGGAYTVALGATLGGIGSIGSIVNLDAGSTLAPGASAGKLTVNSLSVTTGANFAFELDPSNTTPGDNVNGNDLIAINGVLTLDGGTVNLNVQDSVTLGSFGGIGTWTLETFGSLTGFSTPGSFDITSFVNVTGLASNVTSYAINANIIGDGSGTIMLTTVPEPSGMLLVVVGLAGAGRFVSRRRS